MHIEWFEIVFKTTDVIIIYDSNYITMCFKCIYSLYISYGCVT